MEQRKGEGKEGPTKRREVTAYTASSSDQGRKREKERDE